MQFGFVCDQAWQRPFFLSMFMLGMLFGVICGGIISDWYELMFQNECNKVVRIVHIQQTTNVCGFRFGRRLTFLLFTALQFIVSFATSFVTTPAQYGILVFLNGWCGLVNYGSATLLGRQAYTCFGFIAKHSWNLSN